MLNQEWHLNENLELFTLVPSEIEFLGKNAPHNHLGKALLLKFFQNEGRFPENREGIPVSLLEYIAQQLDLPIEVINQYEWGGTRMREHRTEIRNLLDFRPSTVTDQKNLRNWLVQEILPREQRLPHLEQLVYQHLRHLHLEPPTQKQLNRLISSAVDQYAQLFFNRTYRRLSLAMRANLDLLISPSIIEDGKKEEGDNEPDVGSYLIHELKKGAGEPKVDNIKKVAGRLKVLKEMDLPDDLFNDVAWPFLQQYKQQVALESVSHLQRGVSLTNVQRSVT